MLPADDIIINCLLGGTVGSIYVATLCFLWPILINADLIPPLFKPMRREEDAPQYEHLDDIYRYGHLYDK